MCSQSYFTFIDDDASSVEAISMMNELAEKHDVKICYGVIANSVTSKHDVIEELLKYQKNGHQILDHSLTHSKDVWYSCNLDFLINEISKSRSILDSLGFKSSEYLVYPYGKFTQGQFDVIQTLVENHYKLAFNSRGRYNEIGKENKYYLQRLPLRKYNDMYMVKHIVNKAVENNGWLVFLTHSGMKRDFDPDYVSEVIQYCQQKGMTNCTVEEFYLNHKEQFVGKQEIEEISMLDDIVDLIFMNLVKVFYGAILLLLVVICAVCYKKH